MSEQTVRVAIVGCGNIAKAYVEQIQAYENVELIGFADLMAERAQAFATEHGGTAYTDLTALLADADVNVVVNLTIHHAHVEVITQCLEAGKHVYTEKPLAMTYAEAARLESLAAEKGLRLSSAPITYMGEAQQTAWRELRKGTPGAVRLAYAEINHGRIEKWHPNPVPFYDVGIVWDVAIYPITVLTAFLGPVERVTAFGQVVYPDRKTLDGDDFQITTPDTVIAALEFASGTLARLTSNFYTRTSKQGSSMEFHGDIGTLYLGSCFDFQAEVSYAPYGEEFAPIDLVKEPYEGVEFGRGLKEFADALCEGRPHRASAAHAAHVVEVIEAIHRSMDEDGAIDLASTFSAPEPMDWAS